MASPTERSLKKMRDDGYLVAVVERWNPHARIRQDLFGIIDLLGIKDGETLAVQTTTLSNMKARILKISESEATPIIRLANWKIEVHGWRKLKSGWECKVEDLS